MENPKATVEQSPPKGDRKIMNLDTLAARVKELKELGKVIGYIEGVWDIYHDGYVDFIEFAKSQCDVLVVLVASDDYAKTNKGNLEKGDVRPIFNQKRRCRVIAKNEDVSLVLEGENPPAKFGTEKYEDYMRFVTQTIKPDKIIVNTITDAGTEIKRARATAIDAEFVTCEIEPPTSTSKIANDLMRLDNTL